MRPSGLKISGSVTLTYSFGVNIFIINLHFLTYNYNFYRNKTKLAISSENVSLLVGVCFDRIFLNS